MIIELNPITSGYSTGLINDNFQAIEDYVNDKLLQRDGVESGEINQMEVDLDMNGNRVYNLPTPTEASEAVRLQDLQAFAEGGSAELVSFIPYNYVTSINVQGAIEEVVDKTNEVVDAADVTFTPYGYVSSGTVQAALQEVVDQTDDFSASAISFTPYGHLSSTDTQAAIQELVDSAGEGSVTTSTGTQTLADALDDPARLNEDPFYFLPEDFGAIGDGATDDTTALNNFFAACENGVGEVGDSSNIYRYTGTLTIPANATIRFNGASLELDYSPAASTASITTGANTVIDNMRITIPTGNTVDRVIDVGADNHILKLEIDSVDQQPNSGLDAAVRIIGNRSVVEDPSVAKFDRAIIIDGDDITVRYPVVTDYVRGFYIVDSLRAVLSNPKFHTASPNADYQPGHNAILVESTSVHATRDLHIIHPVIRDAGEHGIRLGGQFAIRNVSITSPIIESVGGSGIKVLGAAGQFHKDISISNPVILDCGQDAGNKSGILIQRVDKCSITNPLIARRNKANSCYNGIRFTNVQDCTVSSPTITSCANSGIEIDAGGLGDSDRITVNGGSIVSCDNYGVRLNIGGQQFRRISIKGKPLIEACGQAVEMSVTTGTVIRGYFSAEMYFNTSIGTGLGVVAAELCGDFDGTTLFRNGSTWLDYDALEFKVRKAGTWTAI